MRKFNFCRVRFNLWRSHKIALPLSSGTHFNDPLNFKYLKILIINFSSSLWKGILGRHWNHQKEKCDRTSVGERLWTYSQWNLLLIGTFKILDSQHSKAISAIKDKIVLIYLSKYYLIRGFLFSWFIRPISFKYFAEIKSWDKVSPDKGRNFLQKFYFLI